MPADRSPSRRTDAPLLVGREREQQVLRDHLADALTGQGNLVLIGGEAGVGKTALAEVLCREAGEQGARVLVGRCYDLSETPPYGPWLELFERYPSDDDRASFPHAFAERGTISNVESQAEIFQQVRGFLEAVTASRPLVLLLDDLHWADPASLDLLRAVARTIAALPILLMVIYRADELTRHHPLNHLLPVLEREAHAARLNLRPLTADAVRTLITAHYQLAESDAERLTGYLQQRAEGNAFFAIELLRALEEEGLLRPVEDGWTLGDLVHVHVPVPLRQVIERRLVRLGEEAQALLAVAAVIGQDVPLDIWATVTGAGEEKLLAVVERAMAAHLLEETPDGMRARFVHALVREALYEGLAPSRRRVMHRQIGEASSALFNPDPDAVAYHFQRATDARAVEWLLRAAKRAQQSWAWLTAADRYEAALGLLGRDNARERARLLYLIAVLRQFVSPRAGIALLDEALPLATAAGDRVLAASALLFRGNLRCYVQDYRRGLADLKAGSSGLNALSPIDPASLRELLVPEDDIEEYYRLGGSGAWFALLGYYGDVRSLVMHCSVQPNDRESGDAHGMDTLSGGLCRALGIVNAGLGEPHAASTFYVRLRDISRDGGDYFSVAIITLDELERITLPYFSDHMAKRQALAAEAADAWGRARHMLPEEETSRLPYLLLLVLEGQWCEARRLTLIVRATQDLASLRRVATRVLGSLARHQGDTDLAWTLVWEVLPDGLATEPGDVRFLDAQIAQQLAFSLATDAGDLETARKWLEEHDRWLAWSGAVHGRAEAQLGWAHYHRAADDPERAYQHAGNSLVHASDPRQPLALLAAHRLLGELDTVAKRFDAAGAHLAAALALADACAAPYERALTLLAQAELCAALGNRTEALAVLDEARAICVPLDAKPALTRLDALAASFVTPMVPTPVYPDGITEREVEVLRRIAAGMSNREVAEILSVSVRTIERHIENLYRKIDVRNKADATAYAFRHHLI